MPVKPLKLSFRVLAKLLEKWHLILTLVTWKKNLLKFSSFSIINDWNVSVPFGASCSIWCHSIVNLKCLNIVNNVFYFLNNCYIFNFKVNCTKRQPVFNFFFCCFFVDKKQPKKTAPGKKTFMFFFHCNYIKFILLYQDLKKNISFS